MKENQIVTALKALQKLSRGCSMKELALALGISSKSAYRYVENLRTVGFVIVFGVLYGLQLQSFPISKLGRSRGHPTKAVLRLA